MPSPAEIVEAFLSRAEIQHVRDGEDAWAFQLSGERKLTIPVTLRVRAGRIEAESFFMRAPMENRERFYETLLRRNARARGVAFAIDALGDVFLVASHPIAGIDADELDALLGAILIESDGLFDAAIEIGFESYLRADRAWRASQQ